MGTLAKGVGAVVLVAGGGAAAFFALSDPAPPVAEIDLDPASFDPPVGPALERALTRAQGDPRSGDAWGELGMTCHAHGLFEEALVAYRQAAANAGDDDRWTQLEGIACEALSLLDDANDAYQRTLERDPANLWAICSIARLAQDAGEDGRSREYWERSLRVQPGLVAGLIGLGQLSVRAGNDVDAQKYLFDALARSPRCGPAHTALSGVFGRLGDPARAEFHQRWSQILDPKIPLPNPLMAEVFERGVSYSAHQICGQLADRRGESGAAIAHWRAAVALRPETAEPHYSLAGSLARSGLIEDAIEELELATTLEGEGYHLDALIDIARLRRPEDGGRPALEAIDRALSLEPGNPTALVERGLIHLHHGDRSRALTAFDEAIILHPDHADAFLQKGAMLFADVGTKPRALQCQQAGEALAHLDRALELDVSLANGYEFSGTVRMFLADCTNDPDQRRLHVQMAIVRFKQLVTTYPERPDGHFKLAHALGSAGRGQEAAQVAQRASEMWPEDPRFRSR